MSADDTTVSPTETEPALPKVVRVALDKLVLDPNNPRIMDRIKPWPVPRERWADDDVQWKVTDALLGMQGDDVGDLIDSFGVVGWHEVTLIKVMPVEQDLYLVVDGNRRVVALRAIQTPGLDATFGPSFSAIKAIRSLTVVVLDEALVRDHAIAHPLGHIMGVESWSSANESLMLEYLMHTSQWNVQKVESAFARSRTSIEASIDARHMLTAAAKWSNELKLFARAHSILTRALELSVFRSWLQWNANERVCGNENNEHRLLSWLSFTPFEGSSTSRDGRVFRVRQNYRPLLLHREDVHQVSRLLTNPARLDHWERQRRAEIQKADPIQQSHLAAEGAALDIQDALTTLQSVQSSLTDEQRAELNRLVDGLRGVVNTRPGERALPQNDRPWDHHVTNDAAHLQALSIPRYRGLTGLSLEGLGRINLLVGANNSGKTSVLEAVSLLIHQSDPRAMLSALRRRARWDITTNPEWLAEELPAPAEIRARFGGASPREALWTLTFSTSADPLHDDPFDLIGRARTLARFGDAEQRSTMELRVGKALRFTGDGERRWICPTMSQSPFSTDHELIRQAHEQAVILGVKDRVIQFLREQLDDKLSDIELVENHRFRAPHQERPRSPDLSSFGDGVQRAFQIALMLAGAAGGVLLIDELECAIHTSLLIPFTRLIQELAVELNVQVFISTHSKETVDAFLFNEYRNEDIVAYGLPARGSGEAVRRYVGPSLRKAIDAIDLDIRW